MLKLKRKMRHGMRSPILVVEKAGQFDKKTDGFGFCTCDFYFSADHTVFEHGLACGPAAEVAGDIGRHKHGGVEVMP